MCNPVNKFSEEIYMLVKLYNACVWTIGTMCDQFFSSNSYSSAASNDENSPVSHFCFVDSNGETNYIEGSGNIRELQDALVANCNITGVTDSYTVDPDKLHYQAPDSEPEEEKASCPNTLFITGNERHPQSYLLVDKFGQGFFGGSYVDWMHYGIAYHYNESERNTDSLGYTPYFVRDNCIYSTLAESAPVGKWGTTTDKYATAGVAAGAVLLAGVGFLFFKRRRENNQEEDELLLLSELSQMT